MTILVDDSYICNRDVHAVVNDVNVMYGLNMEIKQQTVSIDNSKVVELELKSKVNAISKDKSCEKDYDIDVVLVDHIPYMCMNEECNVTKIMTVKLC